MCITERQLIIIILTIRYVSIHLQITDENSNCIIGEKWNIYVMLNVSKVINHRD